MTTIWIGQRGNKKLLKVEGHSGYAAAGSDIVCAGISTLVQSYALYMSELEDQKKASIEKIVITEGMAEIRTASEEPEMAAGFRMMCAGMEAIQESYPDYVKVNYINFVE